MLSHGSDYHAVKEAFEWDIPDSYNIGVDVCDKWAKRAPDRLALSFVDIDGNVADYSFGDLRDYSNRMANLLSSSGINRGDRVAILLPQSLETAFSHIAAYKMGCIAVPLFMLFGVEALEYRLSNSGARVVITNQSGVEKINEIKDRLPDLKHVYSIDGASAGGGTSAGAKDLHRDLLTHSTDFTPVETKPDDPALIIYTSGTTGQPKGALHAHRVLLGHLPGVEMSHDFFPQPGDKIWTPADWAWIGGLLDVLLPALHHGVTVVARRFEKFTAEAAFDLLAEQGIRNAFIPPTALKMMRSVSDPEIRWDLNMRSIASGGESLGTELLEWGQKTFGLTINEFYGQTECNMIVSSCAKIMDARPGVMGRAVPGHNLAIVNDEGEILQQGTLGNIAVKSPDPVMFLKYWNNPDATKAKFAGEWLLTGDTGILDDQGWIQFVGRDDDVITSSGYRIGPGEIEDCLMGHPAVRMAGVVGKPDPQRTEIVKAFIVLNDNFLGDDKLASEIQTFVKKQLAAHEYPREVAFVDALPMTTTGKIIRRELRDLG
ncbi:acyl-CoA synthetase [uncultured Kiloniella sp.]|uniref:acyl-CoA synthetase n=1 Tax=uncultured Kiloniella sp. TaxID=1133091 RepID=UPI002611441C|nr:acyl-CoA synthetase [uncultured Kiloniella sp.]